MNISNRTFGNKMFWINKRLFDIFDTIKVSVYSLTKTINKEAAHEGWKGVKHHLMAMLKVKGPETKIISRS